MYSETLHDWRASQWEKCTCCRETGYGLTWSAYSWISECSILPLFFLFCCASGAFRLPWDWAARSGWKAPNLPLVPDPSDLKSGGVASLLKQDRRSVCKNRYTPCSSTHPSYARLDAQTSWESRLQQHDYAQPLLWEILVLNGEGV